MATATIKIKQKIFHSDLVFEVRDARAPLSSACAHIQPLLEGKRRIVVLNKCDQVKPSDQQDWIQYFSSRGQPVMYTNASAGFGIQQLLPPSLKNLGLANFRKNRAFVAMIIGVPNTGKSTLINVLRRYGYKRKDGSSRRDGAMTGAQPGLTRHVSVMQFYDDPPAFLIDTPGIMTPRISHTETGIRLALTGAIKDSLIDQAELAEYLIHSLNRNSMHDYVQAFSLANPTDDIQTVLHAVGKTLNFRMSRKAAEVLGLQSEAEGQGIQHFDTARAAASLVRMYRDGKLGKLVLDNVNEEEKDM